MKDYSEALRLYWEGLQGEVARKAARRNLTLARRLPGFCEHEGAIKRAMRAEDSLSLAAAYQRVVFEADESRWALTPDGFVRSDHA